jgi:hypothetical protein
MGIAAAGASASTLVLDATESQHSAPIAAAGPIVIRSQREFLAAIRERVEYLTMFQEKLLTNCVRWGRGM